MKAAKAGSTSPANEAANFALSSARKPSRGGKIGGTGAPGGRILDQRSHRLALVRREGSDVDEPGDLRIVARFGDHCAAIGVADENDGAILGIEAQPRRSDVVLERCRWILNYSYRETVPLQ